MAPSDVLVLEDLGQQHLQARTLAAALRGAGFRVTLADFGAGCDIAEIVALAERTLPKLALLSILFAHRLPEHFALARELRAAGSRAHLSMCGQLPTFAYAELLSACPELDSVLRGDAIAAAPRLAASVHDPALWQEIPGLAYRRDPRGGQGRVEVVCAGALQAPAAEFDAFPFPARDGGLAILPLGAGGHVFPATHGDGGLIRYATVESSRGCYHACTFCLPRAVARACGGPCYRQRSAGNLADEIEGLYGLGGRLYLFDDEQFLPPAGARHERVETLASELERRGLEIAFTIKCRADDVEPGLFRRLKRMGLIRAYVGIESGCQRSLDLFGKGTAPERNTAALETLAGLGIVADFRCLMFHPWSTLETIGEEIRFLERVLPVVPTLYSFREVELYPGTPLARRWQVEQGAGEGPCSVRQYIIVDRSAELLRRLSRLLFGDAGPLPQAAERLSQAWFRLLVRERLEPAGRDAGRAQRLKAIAARANAQALAIWCEMLRFAGEGDYYDAGCVNEMAARWAAQESIACSRAMAEMVES